MLHEDSRVVSRTEMRSNVVRTLTAVLTNRGFTLHLVAMHYVSVYAAILKIRRERTPDEGFRFQSPPFVL